MAGASELLRKGTQPRFERRSASVVVAARAYLAGAVCTTAYMRCASNNIRPINTDHRAAHTQLRTAGPGTNRARTRARNLSQ
jgi:hypothetical protein